MVGNYTGEERRMQESMAAFAEAEERKAIQRVVDGNGLVFQQMDKYGQPT
jgi:hypothetical protein